MNLVDHLNFVERPDETRVFRQGRIIGVSDLWPKREGETHRDRMARALATPPDTVPVLDPNLVHVVDIEWGREHDTARAGSILAVKEANPLVPLSAWDRVSMLTVSAPGQKAREQADEMAAFLRNSGLADALSIIAVNGYRLTVDDPGHEARVSWQIAEIDRCFPHHERSLWLNATTKAKGDEPRQPLDADTLAHDLFCAHGLAVGSVSLLGGFMPPKFADGATGGVSGLLPWDPWGLPVWEALGYAGYLDGGHDSWPF